MYFDVFFHFFTGRGYAEEGPAPSEEQAKAAAREWLLRSGLTNDDPLTFSTRQSPIPGKLNVLVEPEEPSNLVLGPPRITIGVLEGGFVAEAFGNLSSIEAESTYDLHSPDQLLAALEEFRGVFAHLVNPLPGTNAPLPAAPGADQLQDASATVERAELAYTRAEDETGQAYLVPVYIVEGHMTQETLGAPVPFTTWVPALDVAPGAVSGQAPNELYAIAQSLVYPGSAYPFAPDVPFTTVSDETASSLALATFGIQELAAAVAQFYHDELTEQGWQAENPPVIRTADELLVGGPFESFVDPAQFEFESVSSFVKDDTRVAFLIECRGPCEEAGSVQLYIVVEVR